MKRVYPTIKFVRPRSTGGGKPAVSVDRRTPPVREQGTVSPAVASGAKRKRPTTQSWKGPRRRLDPPSPTRIHKACLRRARAAAPPPAKANISRPESSDGSNTSAARQLGSHRTQSSEGTQNPPRANQADGKRVSLNSLVVVAETPARPRRPASSLCHSMAGTHEHDMGLVGRLRIPDTPVAAKTKPKVREERAAKSAGERKHDDNGSASGSSSRSSSLPFPLMGMCSGDGEKERERVETATVGGKETTVGGSASTSRPKASGSGEWDAGSESESPDLLRSFTMGAKANPPGPALYIARGHDGGGGSSGSAVWAASHDRSASEESDTESRSPDLMRTYGIVDAVPAGRRQASVAAGMAAAEGTLTGGVRNLSGARKPGSKTRGSYPAIRGSGGSGSSHQECRDEPTAYGRPLHSEKTLEGEEDRAALLSPPHQEGSHSHSSALGTEPGNVVAEDPPPATRNSRPPPDPSAQTRDGGTSVADRRGSAEGGQARGGTAEEGTSPALKISSRDGGRGDNTERDGGHGLSAVPRLGLLHGMESTTEIRSMEPETQDGAFVVPIARKLVTSLASSVVEGVRKLGGASCSLDCARTESAESPPGSTTNCDPASLHRCCSKRMVPGVAKDYPAATRQPTPRLAVGEAQLAAASTESPETKPEDSADATNDAERGSPTAHNPYLVALKAAGPAPADVPNPYNAAAGRRAQAGVHHPYSGDPAAGCASAAGETKPYGPSSTPSRGIAAADAPAPAHTQQSANPHPILTRTNPSRSGDPKPRLRPTSQAQPGGGGGSSFDGSSPTPAAARFEMARQQLYKKPRSGAAGRGGGGFRGKSWGRGKSAGRGGGRGSTTPRRAQDGLVGVWRNKPAKQRGERGSRFYITLAGQKLTGGEATRAAVEDKKAVKEGLGPATKDRSTIMRTGQGEEGTEACQEAHGGEKYLHEDALKLSTYGIPEQLVESYARRGIRALFKWQAHCLRVDDGRPLGGGNLVYSAPTSGGKTLVAELLLLRALLKHGGTMALLVVPYVALALEKRDYFRDVWSPLQLNVQAYHGGEGGNGSDMEGVDVAICTIEKANSIVNRLAEEQRLQALSAVVVDEMHLIGDRSRGFLLELMLTKQKMLCPDSVQLVCLSATLPNIECLAKWLKASLYRTQYRPVDLRHFVCKSRAVFRPRRVGARREGADEGALQKVVGGDIKRVGETSAVADPDGVVDLVKGALARDMSVLVFCGTKKWCQQTATLLAKEVLSDRSRVAARASPAAAATTAAAAAAAAAKKEMICGNREAGSVSRVGEENPSLRGFVPSKSIALSAALAPPTVRGTQMLSRARDRTKVPAPANDGNPGERHQSATCPSTADAVRERLRQTPVGLDADLSYLVGAGIAFHHSGLVVEERSILEDAFRQGWIRVLVATSTLAAGVNLPAHRVIIRSPSIGIGLLDSTRYHQMAGRSGRAGVSRGQEGCEAARGVDTAGGESFLILPKNVKFTLADAARLISAPLPKLESALRDAKGGGLERALLEVVVSKTVASRAAARSFCAATFLAAQISEEELHKACDSALQCLLKYEFVVKNKASEKKPGEGSDEDYGVAPTQLGRATFFSGLSPSAAVDVFRSLDKACQNFAVASDLHALVLVTPLDGIEPNWGRFREEYLACSEDDPVRVVGELIGVELGVLVSAAGQTGPKYGQRHYELSRGSSANRRTVDLQPYRRLYGAMLLQQAVEEIPVRNMGVRLGIERGTLQGLQKEASVFCGMVVCFCRHLQWHELANVLYSFQDRLGYSAKPELLPLVRLSRDLPPFRARALLEAGYPSPLELATAEVSRVADVLLRCAPFRSAGWDEAVERYRAEQAGRLAENLIRLARAEVKRQIRFQLLSSSGGAPAYAGRRVSSFYSL